MANVIGVGDMLAARAWVQLDEQGAVNTYNFVCTGRAGAGGTDQDLATAMDSLFGSFYVPLISNLTEYRGTQVYFLKRLGLLTAAAPVNSIASASVGSAASFPLPRTAAAIMKYNTGLRGPRNRGRIFLPFVSADFLANNGRPTVGFDTLVNSFLSVMLAGFTVGSGGNTSDVVWSLLHKNKGTIPTDRGPILHAESADKFGQMHKRGDYGRANASPI